MTWTNTNAFSEYILTYTHGDATVLSGAYRPEIGGAEISPGGIIIPVMESGTVEDISSTPSTGTSNNSLVTLTDYNRRRVSHFTPTQWNRFTDSPNYRTVIARGHSRDHIGDALTKFYGIVVDEGTDGGAWGATPTGAQIAQNLLAKMALIKAYWMDGVTSKMTIFLEDSGAAALAYDQRGAFNYAPAGEPMFGNWMGADIYTTNNALSGSGTVIGGIFSEFGMAYASAEIETLAAGEGEPLTGTRLVTTTHVFGIKALDTNQVYYFTKT
jgi:hypothetical protein